MVTASWSGCLQINLLDLSTETKQQLKRSSPHHVKLNSVALKDLNVFKRMNVFLILWEFKHIEILSKVTCHPKPVTFDWKIIKEEDSKSYSFVISCGYLTASSSTATLTFMFKPLCPIEVCKTIIVLFHGNEQCLDQI